MKTWENSNQLDACFVSTKENFIKSKIDGLSYLSKYEILGHNLVKNQDFIYADIEDFKKFKNSKILVVGGGPTALERDWDPNDYDYIFSCNHFFLSDKLRRQKVDLCILCAEVDIFSQPFLNYVSEFKPYIGFEDYWLPPQNVQTLQSFFPDLVFQCRSRFQGKIGVAPKLLILATVLGAKEVHYIGVDGTPPDYKQGDVSLHSFQKNKKFACNYDYNKLLIHYQTLKDFLENDIGKDVVYKNLGAGHEYNCLSKV